MLIDEIASGLKRSSGLSRSGLFFKPRSGFDPINSMFDNSNQDQPQIDDDLLSKLRTAMQQQNASPQDVYTPPQQVPQYLTQAEKLANMDAQTANLQQRTHGYQGEGPRTPDRSTLDFATRGPRLDYTHDETLFPTQSREKRLHSEIPDPTVAELLANPPENDDATIWDLPKDILRGFSSGGEAVNQIGGLATGFKKRDLGTSALDQVRRIPKVGDLAAEILDVGLAPATLLTIGAGGGVGAGIRGATAATKFSLAGKIAAGAVEPMTSGPLLNRLTVEIATQVAGIEASKYVSEQLPEDMNPYGRVGITLTAGLFAGVGTAHGISRAPSAARKAVENPKNFVLSTPVRSGIGFAAGYTQAKINGQDDESAIRDGLVMAGISALTKSFDNNRNRVVARILKDTHGDVFTTTVKQIVESPNFPQKIHSTDFFKMLSGKTKTEELQWSGIDDLVSRPRMLTKQEILTHIADHNLDMKEVQYDTTEAKYRAYAVPLDNELPGSYRAFLLQLPEKPFTPEINYSTQNYIEYATIQNSDGSYTWLKKYPNEKWDTENSTAPSYHSPEEYIQFRQSRGGGSFRHPDTFTSNHWSGEPNVVAHMRTSDIPNPDGGKTLFVHEIQSDWHQEGRRMGYAGDTYQKFIDDARNQTDRKITLKEELRSNPYHGMEIPQIESKAAGGDKVAIDYLQKDKELTQIEATLKNLKEKSSTALEISGGRREFRPPHGPFEKTWHDLAVKRLLRYAAENNYTEIMLARGEQIGKASMLPKKSWGFYDKTLPDSFERIGKKLGVTISQKESGRVVRWITTPGTSSMTIEKFNTILEQARILATTVPSSEHGRIFEIFSALLRIKAEIDLSSRPPRHISVNYFSDEINQTPGLAEYLAERVGGTAKSKPVYNPVAIITPKARDVITGSPIAMYFSGGDTGTAWQNLWHDGALSGVGMLLGATQGDTWQERAENAIIGGVAAPTAWGNIMRGVRTIKGTAVQQQPRGGMLGMVDPEELRTLRQQTMSADPSVASAAEKRLEEIGNQQSLETVSRNPKIARTIKPDELSNEELLQQLESVAATMNDIEVAKLMIEKNVDALHDMNISNAQMVRVKALIDTLPPGEPDLMAGGGRWTTTLKLSNKIENEIRRRKLFNRIAKNTYNGKYGYHLDGSIDGERFSVHVGSSDRIDPYMWAKDNNMTEDEFRQLQTQAPESNDILFSKPVINKDMEIIKLGNNRGDLSDEQFDKYVKDVDARRAQEGKSVTGQDYSTMAFAPTKASRNTGGISAGQVATNAAVGGIVGFSTGDGDLEDRIKRAGITAGMATLLGNYASMGTTNPMRAIVKSQVQVIVRKNILKSVGTFESIDPSDAPYHPKFNPEGKISETTFAISPGDLEKRVKTIGNYPKVVGAIAERLGINPSAAAHTPIQKALIAYTQLRIEGAELTKAAVTAALDGVSSNMLLRTPFGRLGSIFRTDENLVIKSGALKGRAVLDIMETYATELTNRGNLYGPGVGALLNNTQKAYIESAMQLRLDSASLLRNAGINSGVDIVKDGKFYFHRNVVEIEGTRLHTRSDSAADRFYDTVEDGVKNGVNYSDPREVLGAEVASAYAAVADKQIADFIVAHGVDPDTVLDPGLRLKLDKAQVDYNAADRTWQDVSKLLEADPTSTDLQKIIEVAHKERTAANKILQLEKKAITEELRRNTLAESSGLLLPASMFGGGGTGNVHALPYKPRMGTNVLLRPEDRTLLIQKLGLHGVTPSNDKNFISNIVIGVGGVTAAGRTTLAGFDWGLAWLHLAPVAGKSRKAWAMGTAANFIATVNPGFEARYLRDNIKSIGEMVSKGGVSIGDTERYLSNETGGTIPRTLRRAGELPVVGKGISVAVSNVGAPVFRHTLGRFETGYQSGLLVARHQLWKSMENSYKGNEQGLGRLVNNLTGGLNSSKLGVGAVQKAFEGTWVAFSPRLVRSSAALMAMAAQPWTKEGRDALKSLAILAGGVTLAYVAIGKAMGKSDEDIKNGLNPLSGKQFLSHKIGNDWIGMGGQIRAFTQLFAGTGRAMATGNWDAFKSTDIQENPVLALVGSRASPSLGMVQAAVEAGTGGNVDAVAYQDINGWKDVARLYGTSYVPFIAQAIAERQGPTSLAAQSVGLRTSHETATEVKNANFGEMGFTDQDTGKPKTDIKQANKEELKKFYDKYPVERVDDPNDQVSNFYHAMQDSQDSFITDLNAKQQLVGQGVMSRNEFRLWYSDRVQQMMTEREQVESIYQRTPAGRVGFKGSVSDYINSKNIQSEDKAVADYYQLGDTTLDAKGNFDFEKYQQAKDSFLSGLDDKTREYVVRWVDSNKRPLTNNIEEDLKKAQAVTKPYWRLDDRVFQEFKKRSPVLAQFKDLEAFNNKMESDAKKAGLPVASIKQYYASKIKDIRKLDEVTALIKKQYKLQHPSVDKALNDWYDIKPANALAIVANNLGYGDLNQLAAQTLPYTIRQKSQADKLAESMALTQSGRRTQSSSRYR
jgi:hypothetical protein